MMWTWENFEDLGEIVRLLGATPSEALESGVGWKYQGRKGVQSACVKASIEGIGCE
jgi:hypothetical protein